MNIMALQPPGSNDKDADHVLNGPETVTLENGLTINLNRLKTRELFKLMRIITHGAGDRLLDLRIDPNEDQNVFVMKFMATLLMAIPDAETETIEFIFSLAQPIGLIERPNLSKQDKERNLALWEQVVDALENPELDDLLTILEAVIEREAPDLMSLGKRLSKMWERMQTVGKGKIPDPPDPTSLASMATSTSDHSPNSVTSSPQSTDGPPSTSLNNLSVDFARSPEELLDDDGSGTGNSSNSN